MNGLRRNQLGCRYTFHFLVVPESGFESLPAIGCENVVEHACRHFITGKCATLNISGIGNILANALQDSSGMCRLSVVVTPKHCGIVGIGTHHNDVGVVG